MDLGQSASVAITLTSMMGFAGDVTLAATVADATQAPITDWMTNLDTTTVTVAADGTATAHIAISAMGDTMGVAGKVKVTATSGTLSADASVDVTFNPVFRVTYTNNGTNCVYPTDGTVAAPYVVKAGRKLAVFNGGNSLAFVIHGPQAPGADGFQHENTGGTGTPAGMAYMSDTLTTADTTGPIQFYCHSGTANTLSGATTGNYFKVVP
jgi:hypothetical protein